MADSASGTSLTPESDNHLFQMPGQHSEIAIDTASSSNDNDSSLGSDNESTGSLSVTSSIRDYQYENGRRYHAYRQGKYMLPNDEVEQDRMDLHHHIFRLMLNGRLYQAPIDSNVQRVLDFGTGTGIWAMDFADDHPGAEVVGTDLSPIQPEWVPQNCKFYVDDVESDWIFSPDEAFDYIHGRAMCGSISDFDILYRNCYENLKPGGWIEMQDYEAWVWQIDDPHSKGIPNITRWLGYIDDASSKVGKRINVILEQKEKLQRAGFINIRDEVVKVPIGTWPKDKKLKELGMYQQEHMILCIEPFTLALFTRILNWSADECKVIMAKVREEFKNRDNHMICYFHYVYGQKPPVVDFETTGDQES